MVYVALTTSFRLRRAFRELRNLNGLTWTTIVLLVLAVVVRSWILGGVFGVFLALNAAQWMYFRHFISRAGLDGVDEMTGWEFERWLRGFLQRTGYRVEATPYRGDFGADLILTWNSIRIAVQAKRSSQLVGVRAIQEVVAAKAYYDCERAMVITNSYYTEQAMILARANGVRLRSRDDLAKKLVALGGSDFLPASSAVARQLAS
jgi:restriction system protein